MIDSHKIKKGVLVFYFILFSIASNAQGGGPLRPPPCPPGSQNPSCGPPPPNPVPISGIEILLGAGVLLGARQFLDRKKNK